jgi:hypothetical protein
MDAITGMPEASAAIASLELQPSSIASGAAAAAAIDRRLLDAASNGQTDLVLQLLEEEGGHKLHLFKDEVGLRNCCICQKYKGIQN